MEVAKGLITADDTIYISYDNNGTLATAAPSAHDNSRNNLTVAHSVRPPSSWIRRH